MQVKVERQIPKVGDTFRLSPNGGECKVLRVSGVVVSFQTVKGDVKRIDLRLLTKLY